MDGEEDLQALLGAAADFQEAANDTSRHSLDAFVGYEFEVRSHLFCKPVLPNFGACSRDLDLEGRSLPETCAQVNLPGCSPACQHQHAVSSWLLVKPHLPWHAASIS